MKRQLKIGERIRIRGYIKRLYRNEYRYVGAKSDIFTVTGDGMALNTNQVAVTLDGGQTIYLVDRANVRAIIRPKPKQEEFVCWVNLYPNARSYPFRTKQQADKLAGLTRIRCVKMVEAKDQNDTP